MLQQFHWHHFTIIGRIHVVTKIVFTRALSCSCCNATAYWFACKFRLWCGLVESFCGQSRTVKQNRKKKASWKNVWATLTTRKTKWRQLHWGVWSMEHARKQLHTLMTLMKLPRYFFQVQPKKMFPWLNSTDNYYRQKVKYCHCSNKLLCPLCVTSRCRQL